MIFGVGTDIAAISRFADVIERHGRAFAERVLAEEERAAFDRAADPARFLAKRFAAKEALGKALGTGVRAPATLHAMRVTHDELGKPLFHTAEPLTGWLAERGLTLHLSLSDEAAYAVAFVVVESR